MIWWIKINKLQEKLRIKLDKLQEVEVKVIIDNFLLPKLKDKKIRINLVKSGEPKTKKVKAIVLLELKCLDICLVVKLEKAQEIEDDIYIFTL